MVLAPCVMKRLAYIRDQSNYFLQKSFHKGCKYVVKQSSIAIKAKGNVVPVDVIQAYRGSRNIAPLILKPGTRFQ